MLVPTAFGIAFDLVVRHPTFVEPTRFLAVYVRGALLSAAFWILLFSGLSRFPPGRARKIATGIVVALIVFPMTFLSYALQWRYFAEANSFFQANTLLLAWHQRATLATAARALAFTWTAGALFAVLLSAAFVRLAEKVRPSVAKSALHLPLAASALLGIMLPIPRLWTGGFGVLPPDSSTMQSLAGMVVGSGRPTGLALRTPLPTPPLVRDPKSPHTVVLIVSESIRADSFPSVKDPARPSAIDAFIPDRVALGSLRTQASSTVISCVSTWSGLPPNIDATTALEAPLLFEVAKAAGYHTAYVGSQLGSFNSFATFLRNAGIDDRFFAEDLTSHPNSEWGAEDSAAFEQAIRVLRAHPEPTFLVVHLSSTHYPYLVHDDLVPNQPMSIKPVESQKTGLFNRYKNSILLQERSLAAFFRDLHTLPNADDTVTLFISDHGEQFFEHGAFSHDYNLFEEELRIPGFISFGAHALTPAQVDALHGWQTRDTYNQDIHATLLDLLGVWDSRAEIPLADRRAGRSLVRPVIDDEPIVILANQNGVWEDDNPAFGAVQGAKKLQGRIQTPFECFDASKDPGEQAALPASACPPDLLAAAHKAFPFVPPSR